MMGAVQGKHVAFSYPLGEAWPWKLSTAYNKPAETIEANIPPGDRPGHGLLWSVGAILLAQWLSEKVEIQV